MEVQQQALVDQRGRASSENESSQQHHHRDHRRPKNRRPPSATSKTPRRRNNTNPQSSSPPRNRNDNDAAADDDNNKKKQDGTTNHTNTNNNSSSPQSSSQSPLTTPLQTLSHLLHQSHTTSQTTLHLFRTIHSLHRHALTTKQKAIEAFRLAQAELEHATTAEEYARAELQRVRVQKEEVHDAHLNLSSNLYKLAGRYKGRRVAFVNLQQNSNWNGRCGTIVKMVMDGSDEEDVGRWKVRLDGEWRGKEPDGNYETEDGGGGEEKILSQDRRHVVAKAENLKLIKESDEGEGDEIPSFWGGGSKSIRSKSTNDSHLDDKDDTGGKHHHHYQLDPVEELPEESYNPNLVTPERVGRRTRMYNSNNNSHQPSSPPPSNNSGDNEYNWKRNGIGSQHSPPGYYERDGSIVDHDHDQFVRRQEIPKQRQLQRFLGHCQQEPKEEQHHKQRQQQQQHYQPKQTQHQQQQRQKHYVSPRPTRLTKSSPNMQQQHQQQQVMYDRNQVSSSFAEMVSPEQFAPITFQIETSESFTQQRDVVASPPSLPPNSSFFEEVSPRHVDTEQVPKHHHQRQHQRQHRSYREGEGNGHEERSGSGRSPQASLTQPPNSLPTVVVLEEQDGNNGPPTCVGVQNAGISHVNGLYSLSNQDDSESPSQQQPSPNNDIPPLYFLEAEPILLSDGRYYDMCILRIDCPDSPDHVIWFLSRVDVDPDCLDVKFSDCYYYCRVERSVGLFVPPVEGWNVPNVQQQQQTGGGAVEFGTVEDEEEDHRVENDHDLRLHDSSMSSGLGIVPRTTEEDDDLKRLASF